MLKFKEFTEEKNPTMSKTEANYVDNASNEHCSKCTMFREPNHCTLVKGNINSSGHCKYWKESHAKV